MLVAGPSTSGGAASSGDGTESDVLTLVPSEGDSGELSYVLIVEGEGQEGEESTGGKDDKDTDLGIYDFDEEGQETENSQVGFKSNFITNS